MRMKKGNQHLESLHFTVDRSQPILNQRAREIQSFDTVTPRLPLGLSVEKRAEIVRKLNAILADTMTMRDLYKKSHWQVSGSTFHLLHLLFDKHFGEQAALVDQIAERIQTLGGISIAMAHDVANATNIERPPRGREEVPVQISRLLEGHETIIKETRAAARRAADLGDDGTNDVLISNVLRTNEMQVWFLSEHLVETPTVVAK
jgi:starvation-inducible DNA-binding protein